jgi:hypothetical protein
MSRQAAAAAGVVAVIAVMGFLLDQYVVVRTGFLLDDPLRGLGQALERIAVGLAVVGAWLATPGRGPALIGLSLVVALLLAGAVWPFAFVGALAGIFGAALLAAIVVRLVIELAGGTRSI